MKKYFYLLPIFAILVGCSSPVVVEKASVAEYTLVRPASTEKDAAGNVLQNPALYKKAGVNGKLYMKSLDGGSYVPIME